MVFLSDDNVTRWKIRPIGKKQNIFNQGNNRSSATYLFLNSDFTKFLLLRESAQLTRIIFDLVHTFPKAASI